METTKDKIKQIIENNLTVPFSCYVDKAATEIAALIQPSQPDMREALEALMEWNKKYPPGKIYPMGEAQKMEAALSAVVEKAAISLSHSPQPEQAEKEVKIKWVSIKDSLPKNGLVLTCLKLQEDAPEKMPQDIYIVYYRSDRGFQVWGASREPINDMPVQYWSELPKTPNEF